MRILRSFPLLRVGCVLAFSGALLWAEAKAEAWVTLEGCRLVRSDGNDADSFLVRHEGQEYIFRLYFVDAPETSMQVPHRVSEQAEVFGVSEERVLEAGEEGSRFALRHLSRPFTVRTRWQDARGRSRMPRHFAFVETAEGEDLGELITAAGYARSYGAAAAPPGKQVNRLRQRYDRLEQRAQRAGVGTWGYKRRTTPVDLNLDDDEEETAPADGEAEEESGGLMARMLGETSLRFDAESEPGKKSDVSPPAPAIAPERPGVTKDGKVDLNHATVEELSTLPGVDAAMAEAIIAGRPFAGAHELLRVPGVRPSTLKEIFPFLAE